MRIPQIVSWQVERDARFDARGFNPIVDGWEEEEKTELTECKCGSDNPDDFYIRNKRRCKYCVSKRIGAIPRRKYATCDCGVTGEENFYFSDGNRKRIVYPCKQCKAKEYAKNKA